MVSFYELWIRLPTTMYKSVEEHAEHGEAVAMALATYYNEPWRHYHKLSHVQSFQDALDKMDNVSDAVRMAGWFHDIVWLPMYAESEERSADVAEWMLGRANIAQWFIDEVKSLILATKHNGLPPQNVSEAQVRDADLASLAADEEEYLKIQTLIWKEFPMATEEVFLQKRKELFERMFAQRIFWTEEFKPLEEKARENLAKTLNFSV